MFTKQNTFSPNEIILQSWWDVKGVGERLGLRLRLRLSDPVGATRRGRLYNRCGDGLGLGHGHRVGNQVSSVLQYNPGLMCDLVTGIAFSHASSLERRT